MEGKRIPRCCENGIITVPRLAGTGWKDAPEEATTYWNVFNVEGETTVPSAGAAAVVVSLVDLAL